MIDKYEDMVKILIEFLENNEQYGDDWSEQKDGLNDLFSEVKRLRSVVDYIRDTGRMEKACFPNIPSGHLLSIMEKVLTTEEYLEWRKEE